VAEDYHVNKDKTRSF